MRRIVAVVGAVVLGAASLGVTVWLAPRGAPASALAVVPGSDIYVWKAACTATEDGTKAHPFCTISAAAAVVEPGQTVHVAPGIYPETVTMTRSGVPAAPITFLAENGPSGLVRVGGWTASLPGTAVTLSHVHDVVVRGFLVVGGTGANAFLLDTTTDVTIDAGLARATTAPAIRVTGVSERVAVTRMSVQVNIGPAVRVEPGAAHTLIAANNIGTSVVGATTGVLVTDAPGTTLTNNTVLTNCGAGIDIEGASTDTAIANNIVDTAGSAPQLPSSCHASARSAVGITVAPAAASGTVSDHNIIDPAGTGPLYSWAGTAYSTLAPFTGATGQGGHDIAADPQLFSFGADVRYFQPAAASPALDSGDAGARGALPTDLFGAPHADVPAVTDTGAGAVTYADRGAVELLNAGFASESMRRKSGGGPLDVVVGAHAEPTWVADGPVGVVAYQFQGDAWPVITREPTVEHTAVRGGQFCVSVFQTSKDFRLGWTGSTSSCTVVGTLYRPVAPTRILDTRSRVGVATTTPVPAGGEVAIPIQNAPGEVTAAVVNVTVTQPTAGGSLAVYPDAGPGAGVPNVSSLNFAPGQTVANLVTVEVASGGSIRFHNSSAGTVHLIADLAGTYGAGGAGFAPRPPQRVLDTRYGTGAPSGAVAAHGTVRLDLSGAVPAGARAAVLNLTAVGPTAGGYLTAYPAGIARPGASNLNFAAGQTRANLAIVRLGPDLKVDLYNGSSGTVHLIADLAGYYGGSAEANQSFVPFGPSRILDTRDGTGAPNAPGPIPANGTLNFYPDWITGVCVPVCPAPTAAALNVTVTQAKAGGYLTVYPGGGPRPTASNLNFLAGQTVPNMVAVKEGFSGVNVYNGSAGTAHVIADEAGYFIAPA